MVWGRRDERTSVVRRHILVDFADDGTPLGIEIVTPGAVAVEDILQVFDELGLPRPAEAELKPLVAA